LDQKPSKELLKFIAQISNIAGAIQEKDFSFI
jgi:hypothetical protein